MQPSKTIILRRNQRDGISGQNPIIFLFTPIPWQPGSPQNQVSNVDSPYVHISHSLLTWLSDCRQAN